MKLRHLFILVAVLAAAIGGYAQDAETEAEPTAAPLYSSDSGFHTLIPAGWYNMSGSDVGQFVNNYLGANVYVDQERDGRGLAEFAAQYQTQLADTEIENAQPVNLINGEWLQALHIGEQRASIYVQNYAGTSNAIVYVSTLGIQPVVVSGEDTAANAAAALAQAFPDAEIGALTQTEMPEMGENWLRFTTDDGSLNAYARQRGQNTFVVASDRELTPDAASQAAGFFLRAGGLLHHAGNHSISLSWAGGDCGGGAAVRRGDGGASSGAAAR
ncbi:MAG: hypothetical protein HC828_11605 [Blastochloris sp.]|nr:hypothetical protein [Blastochloris sp.]